MKLSKIEVTRFRCFESLTVDLQPDINVIVGTNGAGKSSILDAIAIALYGVVAANGAEGRYLDTTQGAALKPTDIFSKPGVDEPIDGREPFVQVCATATGFYAVKGFPEKSSTGQPSTLEWSDYSQFRPADLVAHELRRLEGRSELNRYFQNIWEEIRKSPSHALIPLPMVAYYRAGRHINTMPDLGDIFKVDLSRGEAFANALDAGVNFTAMCQWFYLRENEELRAQTGHRKTDQAELPSLRAVRAALKIAVEGVQRIYFDGSPPRLMIDLQSPGSAPQALELAQLSAGYRNLLALVLDFARRLAQANPNWPKPLEAPGILLIDEIELHLHPQWQQTVIPSLRAAFPNTQIIISTHSPAVLTTVRREHVHLLGSDHQFEMLPKNVGTYGAETSHVLAQVFDTHERPQNIETVAMLRDYLRLIEDRKQDTDKARGLRHELEAALGESDPELHRADIRVRQLEVLGRK